MGRVSMWVLGLADKLFQKDICTTVHHKSILWKTGRRILYAEDINEEAVPEWLVT
jgi:hypothetical protein